MRAVTEYLTLFHFTINLTARLVPTPKGITADAWAFQTHVHSEWAVEEVRPHEGEAERCEASRVVTVTAPCIFMPIVRPQFVKSQKALPDLILKKLLEEDE